MQQLLFLVVLAASFGFFVKTMMRMVRAASRGVAEPRPRLDQLPKRVASVLIYFFGQKKVAEEGPGHMTSKHHLLIFWGFLLITVGTAEMLIAGLWPSFTLDMLMPHVIYIGLKWVIDIVSLMVLIAIGWSMFRRIVIKPSLIPMNLDAALILGAIAALMITYFIYNGFAIAAGYHEAAEPVSHIVGSWLTPVDHVAAANASTAALWIHVLILMIFLNYLPYSKHIHLLGAMPNIFLRNLSERSLDMPKLDLEDEEQWGVARFDQFSWKSLSDTYACTECARCSNYCPAYATNKNLSPMQLVHDIRYEMIDHDALAGELADLEKQAAGFAAHATEQKDARKTTVSEAHKPEDLIYIEEQIASVKKRIEDMPPMVGGRIADDTLWACTTCGACQEVCPVFIEHPLKILQMRQNLVLEQERMPAELGRTFRNIERQQNPWGISSEKRMEWAEGLDVPTVEDKPESDYILWVGCAGAFDNRIIKQTKALIKVLNAAGVDYAVLGESEQCTGDPARRGGNEFLFQMMAEANIETLNEANAKRVITSCPHCLHTLRHDYPQFGGDYEIIHHTQLIAKLLRDGKLTLESAGIDKITYHDSCYLGRWNREFDAPREVIDALNVSHGITELKRNKQHGFCCGAGGARMFLEEDEPRINENRTDEIIASGVDTVAVACPFCNIMITDGMKARDKEEDIAVLDIAELVANSIPDVPVGSLTRKRNRPED